MPCDMVLSAINHLDFVSGVPKFLNYRNTYSNIKVFSTAIILYKTNWCNLRDINAALEAYGYVARIMNDFYIPIHPSLLLWVLRIMGKTMSDGMLQRWLKKVHNKLEYSNPDHEEPTDIFKSPKNLLVPEKKSIK